MGKIKLITWGFEFLCITAIAIILSQVNWSNYWIFIPILLILGLKFYEYKAAVTEKHLRVQVQLNLLIKLLSYENALDVRCTYHVPVLWKKLLQTYDYIPSGGGGGRRFSREKGIIGKAFVEKGPLVENFQSDQEFRNKMVLEYKYSTEELQHRKADRKSYLCYPIVDENHKVLGVIYFDSPNPNTFTLNKDDTKVQMIIQACEAIKDRLL
ncbi:hypothetical protein ES703_40707 [subsurface metagenome]